MTRIALTATAMLLAMGTAFAGSDHYDPDANSQPTVNVDRAYTASVGKHEMAKPANVDTDMTTGAAGSKAWPTPGQGNWGN
ncbi:DUF680 domain-containing protein [Mesorhizobium sp. CU2]|uniref:DUF680 domain-containing protein n=1 Tax=unclassified Mesorhizobium TaxID=325217 RepID=UPI00112AFF4D|nr:MULTISPECIES: DUF680 domain-containing protein [unclassified Mesorhizobium]TPN79520.1 DUF680 domain-containing protein [Mesorhizobium sp. CU3]TPO02068.1 DUF680 domain-containing protein [Mesorhizobium sp. CU2]